MNEGPHEAVDQSGHLCAVSAHFQGPRKENTGSGFHIIVDNKYVQPCWTMLVITRCTSETSAAKLYQVCTRSTQSGRKSHANREYG